MLILIKRSIESICKAVALAGGLFILATGFILSYEVLMRSTGHPTEWINEWSVYLFCWAVLLGGAYTLQVDKHVRVELLLMHLSKKMRLGLDVFTCLIGAVLSGMIAWEGWLHFADVLETGETSATSLRVPLWLTDYALPLGFILLTLQFLLLAGERLVSIFLLRRFSDGASSWQHQDSENK